MAKKDREERSRNALTLTNVGLEPRPVTSRPFVTIRKARIVVSVEKRMGTQGTVILVQVRL
jgi:hypothetical protein